MRRHNRLYLHNSPLISQDYHRSEYNVISLTLLSLESSTLAAKPANHFNQHYTWPLPCRGSVFYCRREVKTSVGSGFESLYFSTTTPGVWMCHKLTRDHTLYLGNFYTRMSVAA